MTNYIGDAIEVMSTMGEDQYGAVVTSPPYNIGIDYGNYKDNMKDADYHEFTKDWVKQSLRVAPVAVTNFGAPTSSAVNLAKFMIAVMMIKIVGTPSKILDPFMGAGTTRLAAQNLNVEADGIDLKEWT